MGVGRPQLCEDCGSPLARDQRYCLACGARGGPRSAKLEALLRRTGGHSSAADGRVETDPAPSAPAPLGAGLRLPAPRISALLVVVFLGFGVLLGNVAGSRPVDTLASARSPVKVTLPAATANGASAPTTASTPEPSSATGGETGSAEAEAEPAATPTPAAPPTKTSQAATPAPSKSSAGAPGALGESSKTAAGAPATKLPPVKHVFVIMLSDAPYSAVFGPSSSAPYLSQTLEHQGELLVRYYAVVHEELANEMALLSGQGPTLETAANCPNYTAMAPASSGADEQVLGTGCVYPASTQTLLGQLQAKHLSLRAYVQGIDEAGTQLGACAHPTLGQPDPTALQSASTGAYATFRNPLVYFDSILQAPACATDDVGLEGLKGDLAAAKRTPSVAYVVPDRCDDGNPTPCTAGAPAGLPPADAFLKRVVPEILASKAYKESGLLVISVDEAPSGGEFADSSSCCGQPLFPNAPATTLSGSPRGGGEVGALLLSPYVKGGTTSQEPFDHFSLLRTIEDLFGLGHLGYAGLSAVKSFEPSMFTARKG